MLERFPDRLSPDHLERFRRDGFLAFSDLLTPGEASEAAEALDRFVRQVAAKPGGSGTVTEPNSRFVPLARRPPYVQFEPGHAAGGGTADDAVELRVRKVMNFQGVAPFDRLTERHPRLYPVLESLLGPDPVQIQCLSQFKPPRIGSAKCWHQDNAYFAVVPVDAVAGVWIALDEATVENGCMHVIPRAHRHGPLRHVHRGDCEIAPEHVDSAAALAVPLPPGAVLLFDGLLPHHTPPNRSPSRRRALVFHYHRHDGRVVGHEEFNRAFVDANGVPASCWAAVDVLPPDRSVEWTD